MSRNDDNTTGNLLDYLYHQHYKLISIDLSRQTDKSIPQQIMFVAELENDDATMFSITEK